MVSGSRERVRAMQRCRKAALKRLSNAYKSEFRAFLRDEYAKAGLSVRISVAHTEHVLHT